MWEAVSWVFPSCPLSVYGFLLHSVPDLHWGHEREDQETAGHFQSLCLQTHLQPKGMYDTHYSSHHPPAFLSLKQTLLSPPQNVEDCESLGPCVIMASPGMMQVRGCLPPSLLCFLSIMVICHACLSLLCHDCHPYRYLSWLSLIVVCERRCTLL